MPLTTFKRIAIAVATLGLMIMGSSSARAGEVVHRRAGAVTVMAGGYLSCKITVDSLTLVDAMVTILDATGAPVPADFGYAYRASPSATGNGRWYFEASAGAFGDPQSSVRGSCRAAVGPQGMESAPEVTTHVQTDGQDIQDITVDSSKKHFPWFRGTEGDLEVTTHVEMDGQDITVDSSRKHFSWN
jgi:hypothetical protein